MLSAFCRYLYPSSKGPLAYRPREYPCLRKVSRALSEGTWSLDGNVYAWQISRRALTVGWTAVVGPQLSTMKPCHTGQQSSVTICNSGSALHSANCIKQYRFSCPTESLSRISTPAQTTCPAARPEAQAH